MNIQIKSLLFACCVLMALVGCGGGGGSAASTDTTIPGIATTSSVAVVSATQ